MKPILKALALPLAVIVAWWVFLTVLVVRTANQPNVSELQLEVSQRIVTGTVRSSELADSGLRDVVVEIKEIALEIPELSGAELTVPVPDTVTFEYPADLELPSGQILIPLAFLDDAWHPARVPYAVANGYSTRLFVYPDTQWTRDRCRAIWARRSADIASTKLEE